LKRITVAPRTETIFLLFSTINSTIAYLIAKHLIVTV
jgi:hypothetical protein